MNIKSFFLPIIFFIFVSCKKEDNTTTVASTPCPQTPVVLTPEQLLTAHTWKADEVRLQLSNNTTQYYKRGGGSNTVDYDSDSLRFDLNNTGVYFENSTPYTTTWNFSNAEKSKITLTINFASPLDIYWENVNLTNSFISYSQYITTGITYLASVRRTLN